MSRLLILVGPSGSGKSSVQDALVRDRVLRLKRFVTSTTRAPRTGEKNGEDYWFLSREAFEKGIASNQFYEWANVYGEYYGSDKTRMENARHQNQSIILTLDTRGAETLKRIHPDALVIFIDAPLPSIRARLRRRNGSPEEMKKRLQQVLAEKRWKHHADFTMMNREGALNKTVTRVTEYLKKNEARSWKQEAGVRPKKLKS